MRIVLTGGGTGGHVFPLVAVARELRRRVPDIEIRFLGPTNFGAEALASEGIVVRRIVAGKLPRYPTPRLLLELWKIPIGIAQAFWELYWYMPDVVFGKGGYGMFPVVIVAWMFRIPIVLHESDAVPGVATRLAAPFAREVLLAFPPSRRRPKGRVRVVGNPVRTSLLSGNRARAQERFRLALKPVVLVLGGSQGSEEVNSFMAEIASELTEEAEVIHQVGGNRAEAFARELTLALEGNPDARHFYHIVPFLDEGALADAYAVATVAVSRAGSGAIFELALAGIPTVFIPIEGSAGNHQVENAQVLVRAGAARLLAGSNRTPRLLLVELRMLLRDEALRQSMRERFRAFAKPYAASHIAELLVQYAHR